MCSTLDHTLDLLRLRECSSADNVWSRLPLCCIMSLLPDWLKMARTRAAGNPEIAMVVEGLEPFYDRDQRHE